jgi:hypothetical protein
MQSGSDDSRRSLTASLMCALGFPASLVLLGILEATHTPEPLMAADNTRVVKVGGCVLLAAIFSVLSGIMACLPLSRGRFWPLTWLSLLTLGWIAFVNFYDWASLVPQ